MLWETQADFCRPQQPMRLPKSNQRVVPSVCLLPAGGDYEAVSPKLRHYVSGKNTDKQKIEIADYLERVVETHLINNMVKVINMIRRASRSRNIQTAR